MEHWHLTDNLTRRRIPRDKTKETRHNKKRKVYEESDTTIEKFSKTKDKSNDDREQDSEAISPAVKNFKEQQSEF